jgi:ABC-type branched-subunit amino acid transport system substrate-binding protein
VDTLSGPVPGLFEGAKDGTLAYFAYVNSQGGVDGRTLKLDVKDDAFSGANYTTETEQEVASDFALVGGFSLFDASGVAAIDAAKIPDITASLSAARSLDVYNYSPDPLVVGGARLGPLEYYKKAFPGAIKHVGTLFSNVATAEVQSQAVLSAMSSLGYEVGYQRIVNPLESNFVPDVLRMRAAGVKMVYIVGLAVTQVADLATDMKQEGFTPEVFSTNGVAYDSSYVTLAGSAADGTYTDQQSSLFAGEDAAHVPAVALFDKWVKKVNPSAHFDTYGVYGWSAAELFVQALRAAGPQPTRAGLIAALDKITSFDADGLIAPGDPAQKKPEQCWLLVKVSPQGKWVRTGPTPKSGFICNPAGFYYPKGYTPFVRP